MSLRTSESAPQHLVFDAEVVDGLAYAYRIDRLRAPAGATARIVRPASQPSNPRPGPSLTIRVADGARWARASLATRIVVAG